jgi:hypothetical protein
VGKDEVRHLDLNELDAKCTYFAEVIGIRHTDDPRVWCSNIEEHWRQQGIARTLRLCGTDDLDPGAICGLTYELDDGSLLIEYSTRNSKDGKRQTILHEMAHLLIQDMEDAGDAVMRILLPDIPADTVREFLARPVFAKKPSQMQQPAEREVEICATKWMAWMHRARSKAKPGITDPKAHHIVESWDTILGYRG